MRDDVRVSRDWIDVRHEYLQADGRWMTSMCAKPGFCRQCNLDGEQPPHEAIRYAWTGRLGDYRSAQIIIAAHLHIHADTVQPNTPLEATAFRRLSIAQDLQSLWGVDVDDAAALAANTLGDLLCLITGQVVTA